MVDNATKPKPAAALAIEEKEELLATIVHDLKNPIGAIFGYADILLDTKVGESLDPKQLQIITRIRSTASRSMELIRNYQFLSQRSGETIRPPAPLSALNSCVKSIVENLFREEEGSPNVELMLSSEELKVRIHPLDLERVLSNLINNALKFSPKDGKVLIQTKLIEGAPTFSVNNGGPLIPESEINSLFERYKRGSTSVGTSGSGLGLYIVKKILDQLPAIVEVKSDAKSGTTFTVTFPVSAKQND